MVCLLFDVFLDPDTASSATVYKQCGSGILCGGWMAGLLFDVFLDHWWIVDKTTLL